MFHAETCLYNSQSDLLVFPLPCKGANDASILLILYNSKSLFSPFVSENFQRMSQPASQAKPIGTSFYSHPSLVQDGKLRTAFLDSLAARILEAIYIVPIKCSHVSFGWKISSYDLSNWTPYSSGSHQPQGCKFEAGRE